MRALRAEDPESLGGHRLVARLGAGGMGTVYLARTAEGTPVALKVIRAGYAADPAFRARFRREVRLATGLTGRWVVAVTAADTEAREPWLATAFVPGPSLAEAVDALGPLPVSTVVGLGARLAEALAELHAVELVHRDVKPANILLVPDGPRLIDFGIAKDAAVTALTAHDAVVGTPGYLSPEQARTHGGVVGPASDMFSLGCVLVHAATGRRPFGTGEPAAVLYRTVHEPPDLTGLGRLPPALRELIVACLAKDPVLRPTATALHRALTTSTAPSPADEGRPGDPRRVPGAADSAVEDRPEDSGPDDHLTDPRREVRLPPPAEGDWLPPAVLRLVAERSARALDPPPRTGRPAVDDARGPSRRRVLAVGGSTAAVLAVSGGAATVLLTRRNATTGSGQRAVPTRTIALHADLTGAQKAVGKAQERGARLAVAAHNARADAAFHLALTVHDDRGDATRARDTARGLLARPSVLAVIGPTTATAAAAAVPLYCAAAMPVVLVSVDNDAAGLSLVRLRSLCVTRTSDDSRCLPLLSYLTVNHPSTRTAVVEDGAAGGTARSVAQELSSVPPHQGTVTVHRTAADTDDFGPAVARALATRPQAVVYAGTSPERAAACARALAAARFTGAKATIDSVMDPAFLTAAGKAAEDWVFGAPFTQPQSARTKAAKAFTSAHRARYDTAPGRWSAEAYDAVGLIARAATALAPATVIEHGQVTERLFRTTYDGVAKSISFSRDGTHLMDPQRTSFLYRVEKGVFRFLGRYDQVR
ncbi:bifunctional serine/threonine-protein kinase/ABC transporter substrate-binding protein [Streptomyces sp. NPDC047000]|uniref:bifunctional serine/threonine-protein kinase/ABC transporter substrate-binding protein n=1 Tax=Streptomyces sp. NPDC047000 TaxID=3155474 RepID=UPI0033D00CE2